MKLEECWILNPHLSVKFEVNSILISTRISNTVIFKRKGDLEHVSYDEKKGLMYFIFSNAYIFSLFVTPYTRHKINEWLDKPTEKPNSVGLFSFNDACQRFSTIS